MKTVDPNTIKRVASNRPLRAYSDYILDIKSLTVGFSRSLGRLSWLTGDALNKARAKCKRGQWGIFLDALGIGEKNAYFMRRIATLIPADRSYQLEYHEMLEICFPSFRKAVETEAEREGISRGRRGGGGGSEGISITVLHSTFERLAKTVQKISSSKHEDGTRPPEDIETKLESILYSIARIRKDLDRAERKIEKRMSRSKGLRMVG